MQDKHHQIITNTKKDLFEITNNYKEIKMPLITSCTQHIKQVIPESISRKIKQIKHFKNKRKRFSKEIKLLNGKKISKTQSKSVLFFTTHKCASSYMNKSIKYLNERYLDLIHIDLMGYLWRYSNQDTFQVFEEKKSRIFHPKGLLYSPLRKYVSIPEMERYCVLLMLRDPRDVLVSDYYSVAYSHGFPNNKQRQDELLNRRSKVQKMTVDEYVVDKASHYYKVYSEYCNHLVKNQNLRFLKYEDFMQNFDFWIDQLEKCLKISISQEDKNILYELKGDNAIITENKFNHIRKGTPGDHKNKLTEETQYFLNSRFQDILVTLNYE